MGKQKGHINGEKLAGRHTTTIDDVDEVLGYITDEPWLKSYSPRPADSGNSHGQLAIIIKRPNDAQHRNSLIVTFTKAGSAQSFYLNVRNLDANVGTAVAAITVAAGKKMKGAVLYDHTAQPKRNVPEATQASAPEGKMVLEKWKKPKTGQASSPRQEKAAVQAYWKGYLEKWGNDQDPPQRS